MDVRKSHLCSFELIKKLDTTCLENGLFVTLKAQSTREGGNGADRNRRSVCRLSIFVAVWGSTVRDRADEN